MKIELQKIYYEEKNNIGYIVINDPPANKMCTLFLREINEIVRLYVTRSKVGGIIVCGQGRHFSSGANVDELRESIRSGSLLDKDNNLISYPLGFLDNRTTFNYLYYSNIPVISSINGFCVGSGFELALSTHFRICGTGSTVGLPESSFGFLPGVTGTLRYTELMGLGKALELVLSGETMPAEDALRLGLVDGIVNKRDTLKYCEGLMEHILDNKEKSFKGNMRNYIKKINEKYRDCYEQEGLLK